MGMTEVAIGYYQRGMCVLPVRPIEKRPFLAKWDKYTKVRPSLAETKVWFSGLQNAGIGLVTGQISGLVVLDVDTRSGLDYRVIVQQYPTRMIARTGSGGYHLYYKHPGQPTGNRVNVTNGVDLRADGGFAVLPPTLHASGNYYEWVEEGDPGEFPVFITQLPANSTSPDDKWVTELMKGVSEGGRNDAAARLTGYLFKKGLPVDIVWSMMVEWNKKNNPPMGIDELRTTVESISHKQHAVVRTTTAELIPDNNVNVSTREKFDIVPLTQYFKEYGQEGVVWAVEEWMPDRSIVFLVSPPEGYKTWMLLDLAVSIATGQPFLGVYNVEKSGPVIVVQQEDSHSGITERISVIIQTKMSLNATMGEEISMPIFPDIPIFMHPSRNLRFADKSIMDDLELAIKQIKPVCVIIDPLYSATSTDNYMTKAAEDMFRLKKFRDDYGCSFVVAHHSKKHIEPETTAREDSWGSQFLNAFLETGWQVRRSAKLLDNEIVIRRHSKTMGNQPLIQVHFDISTHYPMKYNVTIKPFEAAGANHPAQSHLYELIASEPANLTDLVAKTGKNKSTLSRQLKQLETTNMIKRIPDGRFKVVEEE